MEKGASDGGNGAIKRPAAGHKSTEVHRFAATPAVLGSEVVAVAKVGFASTVCQHCAADSGIITALRLRHTATAENLGDYDECASIHGELPLSVRLLGGLGDGRSATAQKQVWILQAQPRAQPVKGQAP